MNILVVGGGGREHAIAEMLRRSPQRPSILCAPGNAGTASFAENVAIGAESIDELVAFARDRAVDLTVVGPEAPLCAGIVDRFQEAGLGIFGPTAAAAAIEGDKAFAKKLMLDNRIPTAAGKSFTRFEDAKEFIATRETPLVVKAAGLAAGKGVVVCQEPSDALIEAERMMVDGAFGEAGRCVVIEERLDGPELSILALIDGRTIYLLETSQDHKRVGDGDSGPNTGGMGAYSPAPVATEEIIFDIQSQILVPTIDALRRNGISFSGVLYCGLMLTPAGPKVLEFNCRFGDPETQVVLARLKTDLVEVFSACVEGRLDQLSLEWDTRAAVCVVMASAGYPGAYEKGKVISGVREAEALDDVCVFHAGTQAVEGNTLTSGGRVLGVTGLGETIQSARDRAYLGVEKISFEGAFWRGDIADRALWTTARAV